jgi:hypothetical protein
VSTPIIVLVGAGASHVSGSYGVDARPPLTRGLFDCARASALLKIYSLARIAGGRIERDMKTDSTLAFEEALLRLRQSKKPHQRQMALAVPLYLQALLLDYSLGLQAEAKRYELLVDELLSVQTQVTFISLNYDTLLDNCLSAFHSLETLDQYINAPQGWSLVKPHGSVNWFVDQDDFFDPTAPPVDMEVQQAPIQCAPLRGLSLAGLRGRPPGDPVGTNRYPAIALPEGPKDELVVPTQHLDHLRRLLGLESEIDVLVLGYSAIDTEILQLIKDGSAHIRRMTVVNANPESALSVYDKMKAFGIEAVWPDVFDGSYESWIDTDGLRQWTAEFKGPFPSAVGPDELRSRLAVREYERRAAQAGLTREDIMNRPM